MRLRILNLDETVATQLSVRDVVPWQRVDILELRDLASALRLWAKKSNIAKARERLQSGFAESTGSITLIGSGDFHHLAPLLLAQVSEPVTLLHFDNHPDWVWTAPHWHCGGWINRALELPQVARIITLGPCSSDLVRPQLKGANLRALGSGRLLLYPWLHPPSRIWGSPFASVCHQYLDGHLVWQCLALSNLTQALQEIIEHIPTSSVWLSIDKDVLAEDEVLTNWDQGAMPLDALLQAIRILGAQRRILGADICGEYSPPRHRHWLKRWEAKMDQPQRGQVNAAVIERNEIANRRLLSTIHEAAA